MINLGKQRLLVIAPHADDEVLGCGGLIRKVKRQGGEVYVMFLTVGDTKDFSERGFSIGGSRLSFETIEQALSKNYNLKLDGGEGLELNQVRMQKIMKYKDLY